jgi:hypothetical protein
MTLPGPSKTIRVEPIEMPRPQPVPEPEPVKRPEPAPQPVAPRGTPTPQRA